MSRLSDVLIILIAVVVCFPLAGAGMALAGFLLGRGFKFVADRLGME